MNDIEQILIPVDFHGHGDTLVDFAIGVASKLGALVIFVHVVEQAVVYVDHIPDYLTKVSQEIYDQAEKKMAALLERLKPKYPDCEGVLLRGDAAENIVKLAAEREADLIIIGSHGAKGIEKVLLGSVAERVLQQAGCPTLVFNPYRADRG